MTEQATGPDGKDRRGWTLAARCAVHAARRGDHPAVRCEDRMLTYRELDTLSTRLANALRAAGIGIGSRVGYLGRESEHYYATILACAKIGAVLVPVNWRLTAGEVDHILGDAGAELLFAEQEFQSIVDRAAAGLPLLRATVRLDHPGDGDHGGGLRAFLDGHPDSAVAHHPEPDDAVVQIYTSGTTGLPKGVVLAHRSFFTLPAAMRAAGVAWIDWLPDDVNLITLPGLGVAGIGWFMHGFNVGATNVVMRMFEPGSAVRLIETLGVTTTFAAPAMLQTMLAQRGVTRATFASLRKIAYGAAPIAPTLLRRCLDVFGCELAQIYSSTEAGSVAVCLPPHAHAPDSPLLGAAGLACPGNELKIVDATGETLPPGEIGQVCVHTPARMLEYFGQPEATARTVVDGWLLMGDAGYLDENGYLFLWDRLHDTIIVAGQNIYPAEVERAIGAYPEVDDVAVVGMPDPRWGEAVHACVVPRPDTELSVPALRRFLLDRLAGYKIPTAFHLAGTLPRNPGGKVLRREVRTLLSSTPDSDTATPRRTR